MLEQILAYIRNWFSVSEIRGNFHIVGGSLTLPLHEGQYFRICGSIFNDGLHQYPDDDLEDEDFCGAVYGLAVPKAIIELSEDVEAWQEKNADASRSPYKSESFGGYSYTMKDGEATSDGGSGWQTAFKSELSRWRRV